MIFAKSRGEICQNLFVFGNYFTLPILNFASKLGFVWVVDIRHLEWDLQIGKVCKSFWIKRRLHQKCNGKNCDHNRLAFQ